MSFEDFGLDDVPQELRELAAGAVWQCSDGGYTQARTLRLQSPGRENCYLKIAPKSYEPGLARECEVMLWLAGKLPVPRVLYYGETDERDYLLLSEIPGATACDGVFQGDVGQVVRLLAQGLRMIHSLITVDCPFDQTLDRKLEEAERRVAGGLVDEADFEPEWSHLSARSILDRLLAERPASEDLVFTHGDYCLPNILIDGANLSGFIDLGSAGIADRHQDLALAARSLAHNWGAEWAPLLLAEYGSADIDKHKLDYYRLLDELF